MSFMYTNLIAQAAPEAIQAAPAEAPAQETVAVVEQNGAPAAKPAPKQQSPLMTFLPFIAIFGLLYFFMIRPQKKRQKEQQQKLSMVKAGDRVMLTCGLFGTVTKVGEKTFFIDLGNGNQAEFLLPAIADIIRVDAEAAEKK